MTFREMYSSTTAGLMTKKRFLAAGRYSPAYAVATDFLESSYTFDNEGRVTARRIRRRTLCWTQPSAGRELYVWV